MEKTKNAKFFAVGVIESKHTVELYGFEKKLHLIWADGMVGVIPVFENQDAAKKYADDNQIIFEVVETQK